MSQNLNFLSLLDYLHDGVLMLSLDQRVLFASNSYLKLLGYQAEELAAHESLRRVLPEDRAVVDATFKKALAAPRQPQDCDYRALSKSGQVRPLHARGSYLPEGVAGWIEQPCVMVAVHDRGPEQAELEAQQRLADSERFHRAVLEQFDDVVAVVDTEGRIQWVSPSVERMLGFSPADLVGKLSFDLLVPEDRRHMQDVFQRSLETVSAGRETEFRLRDAFGRIRVVAGLSSPASSGSGGALIARLRDVTRTRLTEDELLRSERLGLLSEILAGISHELRNPLMAVSANAELLAAADLGPDDRESALEIQAQVRRLRQLLDQAMNRPLDQAAEPLGAGLVLEQALQQARRRFGPQSHEVTVHLDADAACPLLKVQPGRLQQALANVILNAFQSVPPGGRLQLRARPDHGGTLFSLADNGPGVSAGELDELFDPFYTTKPAASGLGLSTSKRIIEAHGGRLWATREEPGLAVHAWLPGLEETL